ncbi:magnesium transporter CorA family protein [Frankia sp. CNm7]|uniref:Magnesium transporter CorA family protein n=1 Tax=Frankia nepalensis TaxID=1836974 RepID=A0A937RIE0_9ACTN|nr:magnesium transporter CorA family protein [Frankia nepalensis]MBL7499990.1 magnesium transporter CorA family protein [Frankia nepalensis]MBL7512523.1 magnesium transporter CorA family protein [Frankia nepalensis]MBL7517424.1 magnesium transporter CorA family protein [Frankia nepalensis]MBL7632826.1 magnesium transporter CorA family protein [Frankia nepalensis]
MDVRLVTRTGVEQHPVEALGALLAKVGADGSADGLDGAGEAGFVWVDIPSCEASSELALREVFGFHHRAVQDCAERNRVPKTHSYADHVFVVLHSPEKGEGGHVHYIELDQFVGRHFLVTVHGPLNPAVPPEAALRETRAVLSRMESGRLRPATPFDLSHAIVLALAASQESFVEALTADVWSLEQRVIGGHFAEPEDFLDELFRARHGLLAARTISALNKEIYARLGSRTWALPPEARPLIAEVVEEFEQVRGLADVQREYLQGVIEFYRTRIETKMTIAAERLAVIAAITLPITALSSVFGMNLIVNERTRSWQLAIVLVLMLAVSATLLRWARRRGWW